MSELTPIEKLIEKAISLEREECAKIADKERCGLGLSDHQDQQDMIAYLIAHRIRDRGIK